MLAWNTARINLARRVLFPADAGLTARRPFGQSSFPVSAHAENAVPAATGASIEIGRYPGVHRLAADYAGAFAPLAGFYAGNPADPQAWRDAIGRTLACSRNRDALADVLAAQIRGREAPAAAAAEAERLRLPDAVAIVTGQQAGMFGGPLFTLFKAITALKLAARLQAEQGVPAVAVFWIDAEDHDWDEIGACDVLDADHQPRRILVEPPPGAGVHPVGALRLTDAVAAALDELGSALPATEFTTPVMAVLRAAYRPGASPSEAFGRLLESVLGRAGLVVFDASDPAAKALARPVFRREARFPGRTVELANEDGARLAGMGYHSQVTGRLGSLALFSLAGGRVPIRFAGDAFDVGDTTIPADALDARIEADPAAFSPNVLLRPVVQDALFPTAAYVAGPNEAAYHGQLGRVYEHFGVPRPLVALRASATLLDGAALRFLTSHAVSLEALGSQDERALNALLQATLPGEVDEAFAATSASVEDGMRRLAEAVRSVDPTLEGAARSSMGRMAHEMQGLRTKVLHAAKRRDDVLRRQFARTRDLAFPGGHAQERAIAWVAFLNRYGPELVDRLMDELPLDASRHWVLPV